MEQRQISSTMLDDYDVAKLSSILEELEIMIHNFRLSKLFKRTQEDIFIYISGLARKSYDRVKEYDNKVPNDRNERDLYFFDIGKTIAYRDALNYIVNNNDKYYFVGVSDDSERTS